MVKRNSFWTVVFSFLPGAGHMFMGFMKLGTSIMIAFFGLMAVSSWLGIDEIGLLAPILWFYSFFDCINKRFSADAAFMQFEDKILFEDWFGAGKEKWRGGGILSVALIMAGLYMLLMQIWKILCYSGMLSSEIQLAVGYIIDGMPQIAVGILIIIFGIRLIAGKKKEMNGDE